MDYIWNFQKVNFQLLGQTWRKDLFFKKKLLKVYMMEGSELALRCCKLNLLSFLFLFIYFKSYDDIGIAVQRRPLTWNYLYLMTR